MMYIYEIAPIIKFIISIFFFTFLYSIRPVLVKFQFIMNMITHIFVSLFLIMIMHVINFPGNDPSLVANLRKYDIIFAKILHGRE